MTQRNYRQAFGLKILNSNHAKVRQLKKHSSTIIGLVFYLKTTSFLAELKSFMSYMQYQLEHIQLVILLMLIVHQLDLLNFIQLNQLDKV